ncbi:ABC transporter permease, partial [Bacillus cereus group sp. N21]|uniref:ABC transporter permease n=1 Tax=Bacillus cereus group sp. N21 TaxID=2794591 RepID=UPI0018F46320
GNNVVMISKQMEEKVFKDANPVGKIIEMKGQPMQIIGVYKSDNEFMGMGPSEALIPISLWPRLDGKEESQNISGPANNV